MTDGEGDEVTIEAKSPFSKEKAAFMYPHVKNLKNDLIISVVLWEIDINPVGHTFGVNSCLHQNFYFTYWPLVVDS